MKMFLAALLAVLPFVFVRSAVDPTTVCLPDKLQTALYYADLAQSGTEAIDFNKKLFVSKNDVTGVRKVLDIFTGTEYSIYANSTCTKAPFMPTLVKAFHQCLPANAIAVGPPAALGLGDQSLMVQDWAVDYGSDVTANLAYTTSTPPVPVVAQTFINGNTIALHIHANPTLTVDDTLFEIPISCL